MSGTMKTAEETVAGITVPPCLNPHTLDAFAAALAALPRERIRFLILRGRSGIFCKGLDLRWVARRGFLDRACLTQFVDLLAALRTAPMITLAQVDGETAGGGMGILAACDVVVAARGSTFALPEGRLGFIPGLILPFLLDRMPAGAVKQMVFTGKAYPASAMAAWGMVDDVVEPALLEESTALHLRDMRSCRLGAIAGLKDMIAQTRPHAPEWVQSGLESLVANLARPSVKERLAALADVMEEEG